MASQSPRPPANEQPDAAPVSPSGVVEEDWRAGSALVPSSSEQSGSSSAERLAARVPVRSLFNQVIVSSPPPLPKDKAEEPASLMKWRDSRPCADCACDGVGKLFIEPPPLAPEERPARARGGLRAFYRRYETAVNLAAILVIGFAFGIAKYCLAEYDEIRLARDHFHVTARSVFGAVGLVVIRLETYVRGMWLHMGAVGVRADDVPQAQRDFLAFCGNGSNWDGKYVAAVSLIKYITEGERPALEAYAGKSLTERAADGSGVTAVAATRADYFAMIGVHPFADSAFLLDVGSPNDSGRRALIDTTLATGNITYTNALRLVQFGGQIGTALQLPLYAAPDGTVSSVRAGAGYAMYGLVTGTLKVWEALARACSDVALSDVDVVTYLQSSSGAWQFLGHYRGAGGLAAPFMTLERLAASTPEEAAAAGDVARTEQVALGQTRLLIVAVGRRGYFAAKTSRLVPSLFLLLSVLGALCCNFFVLLLVLRGAYRYLAHKSAGVGLRRAFGRSLHGGSVWSLGLSRMEDLTPKGLEPPPTPSGSASSDRDAAGVGGPGPDS